MATKKLNILMVAPWYSANPVRFFSDAFERMGFGVFRVGAIYDKHGGMEWGDDVVKPDIPLKREDPEWNLDNFVDLATERGFVPDFLYLSEETYQTNIAMTRKIPTVLHQWDGWPNCFARGDALNPTLKFTNHPRGIRIHPLAEDRPGWKFMPGAAAPWVHKWTKSSRDLQFCLMATMYGYRTELCQYLEKNRYLVKYGFATTKEFVETYNRSQFTYSNVNGNAGEVKWRTFEAMAMGCVNIVDGENLLLDRLGYLPNVHYLPIKTVERENGEPWPTGEMLESVLGEAIYDYEVFESISRVAMEKCLSQDTYFHRAVQIIADLGFGEFNADRYVKETV